MAWYRAGRKYSTIVVHCRLMAAAPIRPGVLVVEDAFLVGLQLKRDIETLGCDVIGPVARTAEALDLLDEHDIAYGVLDVNLGDEDSGPVAAALQKRGIPFLFVTGYETTGIDAFPDAIILRKPTTPERIAASMKRLGAGTRERHASDRPDDPTLSPGDA